MLVNHEYFNYSLSSKRLVYRGGPGGAEALAAAPTPKPDFGNRAAREQLYADVRSQLQTMDKKDPNYKALHDFLGLADAADKKHIERAAKNWSERLYNTLMKAGGKTEDINAAAARREIEDSRVADYRAPNVIESGGINNRPITEDEIAALTSAAEGITIDSGPQAPKTGRQFVVDGSWVRFDNPRELFKSLGVTHPNQVAWNDRWIDAAKKQLVGTDQVKAMPTVAGREVIAWAVRDTIHPERPPVLRFYLGHERAA